MPKAKPNYDVNKNASFVKMKYLSIFYSFVLQFDDDVKKINSRKWGNGRDWNFAPSSEGGWIRLWPVSVEPLNRNSNGLSVKQMVSKIIKFTKSAKDLAKNHPTASECQLNEFLQQEMDMSGEIWIPPV